MCPPHVRQRVMSSAKTRARSWAQAMRRGLGEDVGEDSAGSVGRAKSSASWGDPWIGSILAHTLDLVAGDIRCRSGAIGSVQGRRCFCPWCRPRT